MSKQKPNKQDEILDAAADLFASKPFHEVRLEDIAAQAHVGKGTVYLYWTSKEEVYLAVIRRGFASVLERLDLELAESKAGAWGKLTAVVNGLVSFAYQHPGVYRIMRSGILTPDDAGIQQVRAALAERVTAVLREGTRSGELDDPHPELTTQFILSFVRGAVLYPPEGMTRETLTCHILRLLRSGIGRAGSTVTGGGA